MEDHLKLIRSTEPGNVEHVKAPAADVVNVNAKNNFGAAEAIRLFMFRHSSQAKWAEPG